MLDINKSFVPTPLDAFERLFFSLFGLQRPEDLMMNAHLEEWTLGLFKLVFSTYLLMASIVLINLLIAMMSDTYQRIQVSDPCCSSKNAHGLEGQVCPLRQILTTKRSKALVKMASRDVILYRLHLREKSSKV